MNTLDSIKKELDNAEVSMNTGATGEMDYVWYYLASAFIKIFSRLVDEVINRP